MKNTKKKKVSIDKYDDQEEVIQDLSEENKIHFAKLFGNDTKNSFDKKLIAVVFMEIHSDKEEGMMKPHFNTVSKLLKIAPSTLHHWWKTKATIMKVAKTVNDKLSVYLDFRRKTEYIRLMDSFSEEDYRDIDFRDRNKLFDTIYKQIKENRKFALQKKRK